MGTLNCFSILQENTVTTKWIKNKENKNHRFDQMIAICTPIKL